MRLAGLLGLLLVTMGAAAKEPAALRKDDGYRGIWYCNEAQNDEYVYKYSGGLGTYFGGSVGAGTGYWLSRNWK